MLAPSAALGGSPEWQHGAGIIPPGSQAKQRFIVAFEDDFPTGASGMAATVDKVARGQGVGLQIRRRLATGAHLIEANRKMSTPDAQALMKALAREQAVRYVEPDAIMTRQYVPDDPQYASQWHYYEPVAGMNLPPAWDVSNGQGVVVAVLDTGRTDPVGELVAGIRFHPRYVRIPGRRRP